MSKNKVIQHTKQRFCCISVLFYLYYEHKEFPEETKMMYKHWKKILLALTSLFWVSCDNDPSSASGDPANSSIQKPSPNSAAGGQETSSAAEESSISSKVDPNVKSSSSTIAAKYGVPSSSSIAAKYGVSSSSMIAAKYGVSSSVIAAKYGVSSSAIAAKYGVSSSMIAAKYGVPKPVCERVGKSKLVCDDGVTCTEAISETQQVPECTADQLCAKYGVVVVKETVYKCDDGKVYNEAEFRSKYNILDGAVDLYGCPSDICGPDTTIDNAKPLYGI